MRRSVTHATRRAASTFVSSTVPSSEFSRPASLFIFRECRRAFSEFSQPARRCSRERRRIFGTATVGSGPARDSTLKLERHDFFRVPSDIDSCAESHGPALRLNKIANPQIDVLQPRRSRQRPHHPHPRGTAPPPRPPANLQIQCNSLDRLEATPRPADKRRAPAWRAPPAIRRQSPGSIAGFLRRPA